MTSPPNDHDDKDLVDYLGRRSDISRRYQSSANEEPPAELDRAVLAQARAAVKGASSNVSRLPVRRTRWMIPFAVAATVLLSFAIFRDAGIGTGVPLQESSDFASAPANANLMEEREAKVAGEIQQPVDATVSSAVTDSRPPPSPASESPAMVAPAAPAAGTAVRAERAPAPAAAPSPPAPPAPARAPVTTPPVALQSPEIVVITPQASATNGLQGLSNARSRAADRQAASATSETAAEDWLRDIRTLRESGQNEEADAALANFLKAYPDYFEKNPAIVRP